MERLLREYRKHQRNSLYKSVMNMVVRANWKIFEEEKDMCEALRELFGEELTTAIAAGIEEQLPIAVEACVAEILPGIKKNMEEEVRQEVCQKVRQEVRQEVCQEVRQEGISVLIADNMEEGIPVDRILMKLEKRFGLTLSEAQGYMEKFLLAN